MQATPEQLPLLQLLAQALEQYMAPQATRLEQALARIDRLEASQPEWVREKEAQEITGYSQATLARARKKEGSGIVWKREGGLRYLRSSLLAYNNRHSIDRTAYKATA